MEAAATDVTEYLLKRIKYLNKHPGKNKAVSTETQVDSWKNLLEISKKLSTTQKTYTKQTKNIKA